MPMPVGGNRKPKKLKGLAEGFLRNQRNFVHTPRNFWPKAVPELA
jgi:hypothetical protein